MVGASSPVSVVNGIHVEGKPIQLAIDLPQNLGTHINLHLTILANSIMLFLTSSSMETQGSATSMGSLVYAMPDRYNPSQPMSTALYSVPTSLDFTTLVAKTLVRKHKKPCYVGCSINLSAVAGGGTLDDEMAAFRSIVDVVSVQMSR